MSETIRWAGDGSDGPWNADARIEFRADEWATTVIGRAGRLLIKGRPGSFRLADDGWVAWRGGDRAVPRDVMVYVRFKDGDVVAGRADTFQWTHIGAMTDIMAYRIMPPGGESGPVVDTDTPTAPSILDRAAGHMRDRAATYDQPDGERSMGKTVAAFNAITGRNLRESEGWLLMAILKMVRSEQRRAPHADSIEDLCSYSALYGEARMGSK